MKTYFKTPITSEKEAEDFFFKLSEDNLLYHPEDSAHDIIEFAPCPSEGGPDANYNTFTNEEADELDKRMAEVFEILEDPCKFVLKTFYGGGHADIELEDEDEFFPY